MFLAHTIYIDEKKNVLLFIANIFQHRNKHTITNEINKRFLQIFLLATLLLLYLVVIFKHSEFITETNLCLVFFFKANYPVQP